MFINVLLITLIGYELVPKLRIWLTEMDCYEMVILILNPDELSKCLI